MSTQAQYMAGQNVWDQPQYAFNPPLQLEELPYSLEVAPSANRYPQQRQFPPPPLNAPVTPNRFGSFSFGTSPGFTRQPPIQSSSFIPRDVDVNLALDTSSPPSLGASPHSAHISPAYAQPSLNPLEPNHANYQAGQYSANFETHHTPESSPNPNVAMSNHSLPHSYLPTGPMQFSPPLPLPPRQSELQSHYFNAQYMRPQQDSLQTSKRSKPNDDYDDGQGDQLDGPEQEAARPKPLVKPAWRSEILPHCFSIAAWVPALGARV